MTREATATKIEADIAMVERWMEEARQAGAFVVLNDLREHVLRPLRAELEQWL